jgi:uncharacterized protein (DUF305 family)
VAFWRLRSLLVAAAAGASLAGCSSGDSPLAAIGGAHATNATDAAFLHSMTEHEKGSLGITRLAQRRALRTELRGIARTMTTEQQDEFRRLNPLARSLGNARGRPAPTRVRPPSEALADLARVKDATSFDHEFMRTMIEQNQRAIAIARNEVRFGSDPQVKHLASVIESSRRDELEQIKEWLRLWYGDIQPPGGGGGQSPSPGPPSGAPRLPL